MNAEQDPTAIRAEWARKNKREREAVILHALDNRDNEALAALLNAFHLPRTNVEEGRRLVLLDVVRSGDMELLTALTAEWYPDLISAKERGPVATLMAFGDDPNAMLLAHLVELKHFSRGARRKILARLIRDVDARWERPPELRAVDFDWPGYPDITPNTEHD